MRLVNESEMRRAGKAWRVLGRRRPRSQPWRRIRGEARSEAWRCRGAGGKTAVAVEDFDRGLTDGILGPEEESDHQRELERSNSGR